MFSLPNVTFIYEIKVGHLFIITTYLKKTLDIKFYFVILLAIRIMKFLVKQNKKWGCDNAVNCAIKIWQIRPFLLLRKMRREGRNILLCFLQ